MLTSEFSINFRLHTNIRQSVGEADRTRCWSFGCNGF